MQRQDNSSFATNAGYTASVTYSSAPPSTAPSMSSGQYSLQVWGNVTGMSTNYTETNEVPPGGDVSCVTSSTVGAEDRYNFGSFSSTPSNIAGVKVSALLRKTDSGARTVTVQLKSGTTEVARARRSRRRRPISIIPHIRTRIPTQRGMDGKRRQCGDGGSQDRILAWI